MPLARRRRRQPRQTDDGDAATGAIDESVPASPLHMLRHMLRFGGYLLLTGLYQSLFAIPDCFPTLGAGPQSTPVNFYSFASMLQVSIWKDSILLGILFQLYLTTFAEGIMGVTTFLTGRQTEHFNDVHAIWACKSPSDFWGRRWNLLIHQCLKDGVYKPVRALGGSNALAVFAAFTASGLFHEWILRTVFDLYPNTHGITLVFFWHQALLVMADAAVGPSLSGSRTGLPRLLRTAGVVLLGVPLGHWFTDSYVRSDFFTHGQAAFPIHLRLLPDGVNGTVVGSGATRNEL
jgi:hypothetical protein